MHITHDTLRKEPFFWSRLGFGYDPPRYESDGKQIIFSRDYDSFNRIHKDFLDAGVKLHTTILPSGWNGDGFFDYTLTDEVLDAIFEANPDILYMPRVKLNAPVGWCKTHPEEVFVYENGPRTAGEIADLVDTLKHDWMGAEYPNGYPGNGSIPYHDNRPNVGGVISMQSFSSDKWLEDASDALNRLMKHIADSKHGDRVIGYHVAFGMCGEASLWGGWVMPNKRARGDYGITNTRKFREYGLKKYGTQEALLKAWGASSIDEIYAPSSELRDGVKDNAEDFFFKDSAICTDYFDFVASTTARACTTLCKAVKDFDSALTAGVFYGYTFLKTAAHTGHLDINTVLESPYVDFLASPKGYYRSLAGDPGGEQGPSYSMNLKKVWLDEIDNRTLLDRRANTETKTFEESLTLLSREAVKNISYNQGFWWMDLGEGWYDHPILMERIKKLTEMGRNAVKRKHKSVAEILLVTDEISTRCHTPSEGIGHYLNYDMHSEAKLCGAPVDVLRLSDLYELDVKQYKLVVFTNCFRFTDEQRSRLSDVLNSDAIIVWNYAAGIVGDNGVSLENTRLLTGFEVQNSGAGSNGLSNGLAECDFPIIDIVLHDGDRAIKVYSDGRVMGARHENTILCAFPYMKMADIRSLAIEAGCYMYAPENTTVYADNRIVGVFPKFDTSFTLTLPFGTSGGKSEFALDLSAKGESVFVYD